MELDAATLEKLVLGLGVVVIFAMFLERSVAVFTEWTPWKRFREKTGGLGLNTIVAYGVALAMCNHTKFDILLQVFPTDGDSTKTWEGSFSIGALVTAGVIAGGSKGAMKLFQGVLGFGREAVSAQIALQKDYGLPARSNQPRLPR